MNNLLTWKYLNKKNQYSHTVTKGEEAVLEYENIINLLTLWPDHQIPVASATPILKLYLQYTSPLSPGGWVVFPHCQRTAVREISRHRYLEDSLNTVVLSKVDVRAIHHSSEDNACIYNILSKFNINYSGSSSNLF